MMFSSSLEETNFMFLFADDPEIEGELSVHDLHRELEKLRRLEQNLITKLNKFNSKKTI